MIVLGCDPGTRNVGLSLVRRLPSGWTLVDAPVLHSDDEAIDWLARPELRDMGLRCICVESVSWSHAVKTQGHGSSDLVQIVGAARLLARQLRIPCVSVAPMTWRKAIAGSGRATKAQVREALRRQVSGIPKVFGLNRSDATAIAVAGVRMAGPSRGWTAPSKQKSSRRIR